MSDMETRRGKLRLVPIPSDLDTYEDLAVRIILDELGGSMEDIREWEWQEAFNEAMYDHGALPEYMLLNDQIYEILEEEKLHPCGHVMVSQHPDGTLSYLACWYNGGASLEEVLEDAIKQS